MSKYSKSSASASSQASAISNTNASANASSMAIANSGSDVFIAGQNIGFRANLSEYAKTWFERTWRDNAAKLIIGVAAPLISGVILYLVHI